MTAGRIYLLYGADRFTRDEQVRGLKRRMLEEPFGELNVSEFGGPEVTLDDVRAAANAVPFMGHRRMVIVEGLVSRTLGGTRRGGKRDRGASQEPKGGGEALAALLAYLSDVPEFTALVMVEDEIDPGPVVAAIPSDRAYVRRYDRPRGLDLQRWIERRARHYGGSATVHAARRLALLPADDLGLIDREIEKLVTYVDGRAISPADVEEVASSPEVSAFALSDALAERRRGPALGHLRRLFERGERPEMVVAQLATVLHNLLVAADLLDQGLSADEAQRRLGVHAFVAEKTVRQARGWRPDRLEHALRELSRVDHAIKTGEIEPDVALELFVAEVTRE